MTGAFGFGEKIGRDELAEASRYLDAMSEEHPVPFIVERYGVDIDGLVYVAQQRALRAAMVLDGQDPRLLSRTELSSVKLSPEAEALMPTLAAVVLDAIMVGLTVEQRRRMTSGRGAFGR